MINTKKKVVSGMFWKFAERIGAQLVTFIVSIVLARILDPDHYGVISIILVFINIANVFVTNGFTSALIQKKEADNLDFSTIFYFNIVFSIALYGLIFISAPFIEQYYQMESLCLALRILGLKIPVTAFNSIQQAYVAKNMMFKKFFWATLGGTVASAAVGIIMAYNGFGVFALVGQYLTNSLVDTVVLWFSIRWRPSWAFSFSRFKTLFNYGWKVLVSYLIRTIYDDVYSLIIGKKYSSEELAFFSKGKHYPNLIINNVNTSITAVMFPALSQYQNDIPQMRAMLRRSIKISSYILSPLMVGMAATAVSLISVILTDKWLPCVPYLRVCCFYLLFTPISSANQQAIKAIGRSDISLKLEIIKRVIGIILLIISMQFGVLAIAYSSLATMVLGSIINAFPNRKLLGYTYLQQIKDILMSIILSLVMGAGVLAVGTLKIDPVLLLLIQIFTGAVIYIGLSAITKNENFLYLLNYLNTKRKKNKKLPSGDSK